MSESQDGLPWWLAIVGVVILLIAIDGCPQDSADTELARTAREAVELARDAQAQDHSAVIWSGRFRMLGLILGMSVPIVVAFLIWRSSCKGEIDPIEVLAELERHTLAGPVGPRPLKLFVDPTPIDASATTDRNDPADSNEFVVP